MVFSIELRLFVFLSLRRLQQKQSESISELIITSRTDRVWNLIHQSIHKLELFPRRETGGSDGFRRTAEGGSLQQLGACRCVGRGPGGVQPVPVMDGWMDVDPHGYLWTLLHCHGTVTPVDLLNMFFMTLQALPSCVMNNGSKFHLKLQPFFSALIVLGKQQWSCAVTAITPHSSA